MCIFELDSPECNPGPVTWVALGQLQSLSLSTGCHFCVKWTLFFFFFFLIDSLRGLNTKRAEQYQGLAQLSHSFKRMSFPFFAVDGTLCKNIYKVPSGYFQRL